MRRTISNKQSSTLRILVIRKNRSKSLPTSSIGRIFISCKIEKDRWTIVRSIHHVIERIFLVIGHSWILCTPTIIDGTWSKDDWFIGYWRKSFICKLWKSQQTCLLCRATAENTSILLIITILSSNDETLFWFCACRSNHPCWIEDLLVDRVILD